MAAAKGKQAAKRDAATMNAAVATAGKFDTGTFSGLAQQLQVEVHKMLSGMNERIIPMKDEFNALSLAAEVKRAQLEELASKELVLLSIDELEAEKARIKLEWIRVQDDAKAEREREEREWQRDFNERMRVAALAEKNAKEEKARLDAIEKDDRERAQVLRNEQLVAREAALAAAEAALKSAKEEAVAIVANRLKTEHAHALALIESEKKASALLAAEQLKNANIANEQLLARIAEQSKQLNDANTRVSEMAKQVVDSKAQREVVDSLKAALDNQSGTTKVGSR